MSKPKSQVKPHLFQPDPAVPPDMDGRHACRCGLVGQAGDAHHTLPPPVEDVRQWAAGEKED